MAVYSTEIYFKDVISKAVYSTNGTTAIANPNLKSSIKTLNKTPLGHATGAIGTSAT
jgi:hypothetical protein